MQGLPHRTIKHRKANKKLAEDRIITYSRFMARKTAQVNSVTQGFSPVFRNKGPAKSIPMTSNAA